MSHGSGRPSMRRIHSTRAGARRRPTAVAVHDDGDVSRQEAKVERRARASSGDPACPRQHMVGPWGGGI